MRSKRRMKVEIESFGFIDIVWGFVVREGDRRQMRKRLKTHQDFRRELRVDGHVT